MLRAVGMNCTRDGAVVERVKTTTLRLFKKTLLAPVKITPLHSHTLIVSNCCCHDRFISEPAAMKIIWMRARGPPIAVTTALLHHALNLTDQ